MSEYQPLSFGRPISMEERVVALEQLVAEQGRRIAELEARAASQAVPGQGSPRRQNHV